MAKKQDFNIHRTLPSKESPIKKSPSEAAHLEATAQKGRIKRALVSIALIIFCFFLVIGLWDAVELSQATKKMFGSGNIFSLLNSNGLNGESRGRVNVLLIGYSQDDPGHAGATLTDSIMLLSLNTTNHTGYTLSIPRDLYVRIPGFDYAKINEAYQDGNRANLSLAGYPTGGVGLLESIVSDKLAMPIDYFALINYAAFRDTVNAVGGITINVNSPDPRGLYDPSLDYTTADCCALAKYPNGPVTLNGKQALNLARARGDAYGSYGFGQADFDRTEHQRQMLLALRQKAVSWKVVLNPTRSGHLFDGLASNVKTDVTANDVLPLYRLFNSVPQKNMQSVSLRALSGKNYLTDYYGSLVPAAGVNDYSAIQAALSQLNNQ